MGPKTASPGKPATYEDIVALPEHLVGELIDGELIVSPRPTPRHALASSTLGVDLGGPFDRGRGGPGGWRLLDEPELHFGRDVLVPDLAGWRRERMPRLPKTAYFELAPDWICEVLSPSTGLVDRTRKLDIYTAQKVGWLWLLDPLQRTLEVLRLEGPSWMMAGNFGGDQTARIPPFDAIALELAALWEDEQPDGGETPPAP
jgi:Uma2 family endonuclease